MPLIAILGIAATGAAGGFILGRGVAETASIVRWIVIGGVAFAVAKATKVI